MIKLNIQLFGGGADEWDKNDGNKDGYVQLPYRGQILNIPVESVTKLGSGWTQNSEKRVNAIAYIQYYLETGKGPTGTGVVRKWIEGLSESERKAIGVTVSPSGLQNWNAHYDSSELVNGLIPAVREAIENNEVFYKDERGNQIYINPDDIAIKTTPGYHNVLGAPIGRDNNSGDFVYRTEDGKVVTEYGTPSTGYTNFDGGIFNPNDQGEYVNDIGETDSTTVRNNTDNPWNSAFNEYYNDIMNPNQQGTLGYKMLQNNVNLFTKEAENAGVLAEASMQAQALAQAQTTRQVVDSLRNERMSQLRAGMNESQLADRELQLLIGSSQQMAGQNQTARQGALEASMGRSTAYEQAFNQYLEQATALGQNAAANYGAAAGDAIRQMQAYKDYETRWGRAEADRYFGLISGANQQG